MIKNLIKSSFEMLKKVPVNNNKKKKKISHINCFMVYYKRYNDVEKLSNNNTNMHNGKIIKSLYKKGDKNKYNFNQ